MTLLSSAATLVLGLLLLLSGGLKVTERNARTSVKETALTLLQSQRAVVSVWYVVTLAEIGVGVCFVMGEALPIATALCVTLTIGSCGYLVLGRALKPGRPCGCMGTRHAAPISALSLARSCLLIAMSVLALARAERWYSSAGAESFWLDVIGLGLATIVLSPEIAGDWWARLGDRTLRRGKPFDCGQVRPLRQQVLALIENSRAWLQLESDLSSRDCLDYWADGCWRFASFDAATSGGTATVVFGAHFTRDGVFVEAAVVGDDGLVVSRVKPSRSGRSRRGAFASAE